MMNRTPNQRIEMNRHQLPRFSGPFDYMIVSLHFTIESWLILFFVPIIGGFLGVYLTVSMNHRDESEDDQEITDIVCDKRALGEKNILYEL